MRYLIVMTLILLSCQEKNEIIVGDCVQKPDEVRKWKVSHIKNEFLTLDSHKSDQQQQIQVRKSDSWIETSCE